MLRVILLLIGLPAWAQIDLHAHLIMKPGMNYFLQGEWNEPPRTHHWSERLKTKISSESLAAMTDQTRPKLIVISLYAHPYFGYSFSRDGFHFNLRENVRKSIDEEYQLLLTFVREHADHFAIAKNAREAKAILKQKKTVIVLSLEGAWATLENNTDFDLWIKERGLAIVTPVHLTPDEFGGVALMKPLMAFFNSTFDFIASLWRTNGKCLKSYCKSPTGLTPAGLTLLDELMKREVWIDAAHANEIEIQTLIEKSLLPKNNFHSKPLPLLVTHTQFREHDRMERALGDYEISYIREHDGIVGFIPTEQMMPLALEKKQISSGCVSGLDIFRSIIWSATHQLGDSKRVALGSDINAPLNGLSPACGDLNQSTSTTDVDLNDLRRQGFYSYSQWNTLSRFVSPSEAWNDQNLEHFLKLWAQIRP